MHEGIEEEQFPFSLENYNAHQQTENQELFSIFKYVRKLCQLQFSTNTYDMYMCKRHALIWRK